MFIHTWHYWWGESFPSEQHRQDEPSTSPMVKGHRLGNLPSFLPSRPNHSPPWPPTVPLWLVTAVSLSWPADRTKGHCVLTKGSLTASNTTTTTAAASEVRYVSHLHRHRCHYCYHRHHHHHHRMVFIVSILLRGMELSLLVYMGRSRYSKL